MSIFTTPYVDTPAGMGASIGPCSGYPKLFGICTPDLLPALAVALVAIIVTVVIWRMTPPDA